MPDIVNQIVNSNGLTVLLNRAIDGLNRLKSQGQFTRPKRVDEITAQYILENNQIAQFLQEIENGEVSNNPAYTVTGDIEFTPLLYTHNVPAKELYAIYSQWAKDSGYRAKGKHNFGEEMRKLGYSQKTNRDKNNTKPYKAWIKN